MQRVVVTVILFGFLFVDFLFFHDMFKQGEVTTVAQYLTGLLSIPVIMFLGRWLLLDQRSR